MISTFLESLEYFLNKIREIRVFSGTQGAERLGVSLPAAQGPHVT